MKGIKILYLVLALALPICIFLFLKFFGKNQFDVPPLFSDGVIPVEIGCPPPPQGPYVIQADYLRQLGWSDRDSLTLFYFYPGTDLKSNAFTRIREKFNSQEIHIANIRPISVRTDTLNALATYVPDNTLSMVKKCILFIPEESDLVLVDHQRRIRGYYSFTSREEIDRLLMEATIILKKY